MKPVRGEKTPLEIISRSARVLQPSAILRSPLALCLRSSRSSSGARRFTSAPPCGTLPIHRSLLRNMVPPVMSREKSWRSRGAYEGSTPDLLSWPHVVAVPNDAIFQVSLLPDGRSRKQNAPLDGGSRPYPAAAPHRGVPDQGNFPSDYNVVPDHHWPFEGGRGMEPGVTIQPKTPLQPLPRYRQPNLPQERIPLGRFVGLQTADIRPVKAALVPCEFLPGFQQAREDVLGEIEEGIFGDVLKHLGFEHVDAGVGQVALGFAGIRLFLEAHDVPLEVQLDHPVLRGVRDAHQRQRRQSPPLLMEGHDLSHVHVGQGVAHDDDEGLVEAVGDTLDAPRRPHKFVLAGYADLRAVHAGRTPVGVQDGVGQVVDVDVDLVQPRLRQELEDVLDYRLAYDGGHRLGDLAGEREKSCALTGSQNHRLYSKVLPSTTYTLGVARASLIPKDGRAALLGSTGRLLGHLSQDHPRCRDRVLVGEEGLRLYREEDSGLATGVSRAHQANGPLDALGPDDHPEARRLAAYLHRYLDHAYSFRVTPARRSGKIPSSGCGVPWRFAVWLIHQRTTRTTVTPLRCASIHEDMVCIGRSHRILRYNLCHNHLTGMQCT